MKLLVFGVTKSSKSWNPELVLTLRRLVLHFLPFNVNLKLGIFLMYGKDQSKYIAAAISFLCMCR